MRPLDRQQDRAQGFPSPEGEDASSAPPLGWRIGGALLLAAGLLATLWVAYLVGHGDDQRNAFWLWLFALAVLPVGLNFGVRDPLHLRRPRADVELYLVCGILVLATLLRLQDLTVTNQALPYEQALAEAIAQISSGAIHNLFALDGAGSAYLGYAPAALLVRPLGNDILALRLFELALGLLSLLLLYLVARRLVPVAVAALVTLLLAVSPWHPDVGQLGIGAAAALLGGLLLLYMTLRAIDSHRSIEYLLAGYAAGLCLAVYPAAWPALLLAPIYLLYRMAGERSFLRRHGRGLLLLGLGVLTFVAPMLANHARLL